MSPFGKKTIFTSPLSSVSLLSLTVPYSLSLQPTKPPQKPSLFVFSVLDYTVCTFWLLWPVVKSQSDLIKPPSGSQPPTTENTSHIDSNWVLTSELERKGQNLCSTGMNLKVRNPRESLCSPAWILTCKDHLGTSFKCGLGLRTYGPAPTFSFQTHYFSVSEFK
jgi:hypothetical protein